MVTTSRGQSQYNGLTLGLRKRLAGGYQLEANYVLSKDKDDDSNERDPFTDRSFNFFDLDLDYALSDRDIRHKFNFFGYFELPAQRAVSTRGSRRAARSRSRPTRGRSTASIAAATRERKDNEYFSFDWRLSRAFRLGDRRRARCRRSRCSTRSTTRTTSTR